MKIGDQLVCNDNKNFVTALSDLIKAGEFLKSNELCELIPGKYEHIQLPVDQSQLSDGSLFRIRGNIWFSGPSVTLIKDERLEAPLVIVTTKDNVEILGITPATRQYILHKSRQYDDVLGGDVGAYSSKVEQKYGFFGQEYFCYNGGLKTRKK